MTPLAVDFPSHCRLLLPVVTVLVGVSYPREYLGPGLGPGRRDLGEYHHDHVVYVYGRGDKGICDVWHLSPMRQLEPLLQIYAWFLAS